MHKYLKNERGLTLLELLVASFLSVIVAGAALHFYLTEHKVWLAQSEVADLQQNARACLDEICGTVRMAGYGLNGGHPAYRIGNNSLVVYFDNGADVDTILFYIQGDEETSPCLVRQLDQQTPEIFAEDVEALTVNRLTASLLEIGIISRSQKADTETMGEDEYRRRELTSRVRVRNIGL
jgi:Tfp pilus assembly protein PilW